MRLSKLAYRHRPVYLELACSHLKRFYQYQVRFYCITSGTNGVTHAYPRYSTSVSLSWTKTKKNVDFYVTIHERGSSPYNVFMRNQPPCLGVREINNGWVINKGELHNFNYYIRWCVITTSNYSSSPCLQTQKRGWWSHHVVMICSLLLIRSLRLKLIDISASCLCRSWMITLIQNGPYWRT